MTQADIRAALISLGIFCSPNLGATNYAKPTLAYLQGPLFDAFRARYWAENLDTWKVKWACRDFARAFACIASEANADTTGSPSGMDAIAVFAIWFRPDLARAMGVDAHAIYLAFTDVGPTFVDPQNNTIWNASDSERGSVFFLE